MRIRRCTRSERRGPVVEIAPAAGRPRQRSIAIDRLQLSCCGQHKRELVHEACARVIDPRHGPCILSVNRVDARVHQRIQQSVVDGITLLPLPVGARDGAAITVHVPVIVEPPVGGDHGVNESQRQPTHIAVETAIVGRIAPRGDARQRHVLRRANAQQTIAGVIGNVQGAFAVTGNTERPPDSRTERGTALADRTRGAARARDAADLARREINFSNSARTEEIQAIEVIDVERLRIRERSRGRVATVTRTAKTAVARYGGYRKRQI